MQVWTVGTVRTTTGQPASKDKVDSKLSSTVNQGFGTIRLLRPIIKFIV